MKAMICEMCQSNDLVKQNGMYVCQYCGTKYSVEEARKLLVEGTVKIDHSDEIQNLLVVARKARKENDFINAQKYYEMLLIKDPFNWEAVFYSAFYSYTIIDGSQITNKSIEAERLLGSVILMINKLDEASKKSALLELEPDIRNLVGRLAVDSPKYYESLPWAKRDVVAHADQICYIADLAFTLADAFRENNMASKAVALYAFAISTLETHAFFTVQEQHITIQLSNKYYATLDRMANASNYIRQGAPDYKTKREGEYLKNNSSKKGCYVATAVYGSYDCPQVWTLRRFRDNTLAETWYGRAFIRAYYAMSPALVKWFGKAEWFKSLWKPMLDRMVEKLNGNGVADTPYDDSAW